jgi:hypothetical protein
MTAPSPANHSKSGETPVNARDESPLPSPEESSEPSPEEESLAAVATAGADDGVVVEGAVVLVVDVEDPAGAVVEVVDVVVEVVVVVPFAAVNWIVTGSSGRLRLSVVSSAV